MRRTAIVAALIGGGVIVARALVPRVHARMADACRDMFERMPNDFPPRRMMSGIEEIRATSARTLQLLEGLLAETKGKPLEMAYPTRAEEAEMVHA